jgi:hypothetical protein
MERSIVCGVDGSADSQAALAVAAGMAERLGVRLVLAHVVEYVHSPYAAAGALGTGAVARATLTAPLEQVRAGERLLEEVADQAGLEQAERRVVSGLAAEGLATWPMRKGPSSSSSAPAVAARSRPRSSAAFRRASSALLAVRSSSCLPVRGDQVDPDLFITIAYGLLVILFAVAALFVALHARQTPLRAADSTCTPQSSSSTSRSLRAKASG